MKLIGLFLCVVIFLSTYSIVQGVREMILDRIELLYLDPTLIDLNCTVKRISRTDYALNLYLTIFADGLHERTDINLQAYTLHNNEYRLAPLSLKRNICVFFNMEWNFIKSDIIKSGNFPVKCPVPKGFYYIKDFILDSKNFPQFPSIQAALLYINFTHNDALLASLKIYVRFNQDAKIINKVLSEQ